MVDVGSHPSQGGLGVLVIRLAVMVTTLLIVVLALSFPLPTGRADVPAHAARIPVRPSDTVGTKYTVRHAPVRPMATKAEAARRLTTPTAPAPTATPPASVTTTPGTSPVAPTSMPPVTGAVTEATVTPSVPNSEATAPTTASVVAGLVLRVKAAGIEPGPNWSWSLGNTSTSCGAIPDAGIATGCTSGAPGAVTTVFSGSPTLALVAHELANAETENDAVLSLVAEVGTAEAGTSWSPIDAVASCLVEHFMGFQDNAAGTWRCPVDLASTVAADIHDADPVAAAQN